MKAAPSRTILLDSLRGWAALSVITFHLFSARVLPTFPGSDWLFYVQADRAAVLVFFVLSGYVIGLTNRQPWSPAAVRAYGWRRILRLYPIYFVALALGWAALPSTDLRTLGGHLLFLQDSDPGSLLHVPNLPGNEPLWSLHYEAFFYLCFIGWWRWPVMVPLSLAAALVTSIGGTIWASTPAFLVNHATGAAFWLAGLMLARLPVDSAAPREGRLLAHILWLHAIYQFAPAYLLQRGLGLPGGTHAYLPAHDLSFLPGCVAAVAVAAGCCLPAARLWHATAAAVAAAGLAMIVVAHKDLLEARWAISTLYVAAGVAAWFLPGPLGLTRLAALGAWSYALYVVHMPVLVIIARHFPAAGGLATVVGALAVVFPLAWWLESRFQPWVRGLLNNPRPV